MFENSVPTSPCVYSCTVNPWRDGTFRALALDPLPPLCRNMKGSTTNSSGGGRVLYRRIRCCAISRDSFRRITKTFCLVLLCPSPCLVAARPSRPLVLPQHH